jgi:hypothetical protein
MLGRMAREDMRAGDGDRKLVADQLRTALDEGRLDLTEYDERLQRTYAAKTFGDLDGLLDDLPGTVPVGHSQMRPATAPRPPAPADQSPVQSRRPPWEMLGPYGGAFTVCVLIWLITSISAHRLVNFWPVWLLIPLFLGLVGQWQGRGGGRDRDARRAARRDRRNR